jgi:hypothetical protein
MAAYLIDEQSDMPQGASISGDTCTEPVTRVSI